MDLCEALHVNGPLPASELQPPRFEEKPAGFFLAPQVFDVDTLIAIGEGEVELDAGYLQPRKLSRGESFRVPAGRMLGLRVVGGPAKLAVEPVSAR